MALRGEPYCGVDAGGVPNPGKPRSGGKGLDRHCGGAGSGRLQRLESGYKRRKSLAAAAGKPLIGVGTLDLESYPYVQSGLPVCALLDAGRSEVASAMFGPEGRRTREDLVCPVEELLDTIEIGTLFCGEGVINWSKQIRERLGASAMVVSPAPASRLWALCEVGWQRLEEGDTSDTATLQPLYLRMPSIGGPKRRDRNPQRS